MYLNQVLKYLNLQGDKRNRIKKFKSLLLPRMCANVFFFWTVIFLVYQTHTVKE
jgi:hypothetical protein